MRFSTIIFWFFLFSKASVFGQELIQLHPIVGDTVDFKEKSSYYLFPSYRSNFDKACIYKSVNENYFAKVYRLDGTIDTLGISQSQIIHMYEQINGMQVKKDTLKGKVFKDRLLHVGFYLSGMNLFGKRKISEGMARQSFKNVSGFDWWSPEYKIGGAPAVDIESRNFSFSFSFKKRFRIEMIWASNYCDIIFGDGDVKNDDFYIGLEKVNIFRYGCNGQYNLAAWGRRKRNTLWGKAGGFVNNLSSETQFRIHQATAITEMNYNYAKLFVNGYTGLTIDFYLAKYLSFFLEPAYSISPAVRIPERGINLASYTINVLEHQIPLRSFRLGFGFKSHFISQTPRKKKADSYGT